MTLTVSLLDEPLTRAVLDGTALPAGLEVSPRTAASVDANSRAMQDLFFDVAEMSFATYLRARLVDGAPLIALPAFTGRRFVQPLAATRQDSDLQGAQDLSGCRVAVPQYWMTSSVWHRAVLHDYYRIPPEDLTWITTADERFELTAPGVRVERCADGRTPTELVLAGEADAVLAPRPPSGGLRSLFTDPVAEQARYHQRTGVLPIMHLVVLREELLAERTDDVAAFWQALHMARERARPGPPVPGVPDEAGNDLFATDPWSYGVAPNTAALETLLTSAHREGLITELPQPSDVFVSDDLLR
jgi:4,5-dihydroxyphthalate decarboxylase